MPRINMTNITNANNVGELVTAVNTASGFYLFNIITLAIFIVLFIVFRQRGFNIAFSSASFLTALLSLILRSLNLISDTVFWAWIILAAISTVMIILSDDSP